MKLDDIVKFEASVDSTFVSSEISYRVYLAIERDLKEKSVDWIGYVDVKGDVCLMKRDSIICIVYRKRKCKWYQGLFRTKGIGR